MSFEPGFFKRINVEDAPVDVFGRLTSREQFFMSTYLHASNAEKYYCLLVVCNLYNF